MSVAYYIVLDLEEPGFETFVNGKAVAHAADELEALCEKAGLPTLESFMGQSMDELAEMLDDEDEDDYEEVDDEDEEEDDDVELPAGARTDRKWFDSQDGVVFVDALMQAIRNDLSAVVNAEEVLDDLAEYRGVLSKAADVGAKWHLALDF